MEHALLAANLVLVAGTAAGCGGGPPTDASKDDFCGVFEDFNKTVGGMDADASQEELDKLEKELSDAEQKDSDAFDEYLAKTCEDV